MGMLAAVVAAISFILGTPDRESILYRFHGLADGLGPRAGVIADRAGNLYGTTFNGGGGVSEGVVFRLEPPRMPGGAWKETVLHRFLNIFGGQYPWSGLVADAHGDLFGTAWLGGILASGVVFELSPPATSDGEWKYSIIHSFSGADGGGVETNLAIDGDGNLFGTTSVGGTGQCLGGGGCGVVFELSPMGAGLWLESVLYNFPATSAGDGGTQGDVALDGFGNVYGTTFDGPGGSTVFRLMRPMRGSVWKHEVIHFFSNLDEGVNPLSGVTLNRFGDVFGTTQLGGHAGCEGVGCGVVFRLRQADGGAWSYRIVYKFSGTGDGSMPSADLIIGRNGDLYGTTQYGGVGTGCSSLGCGVAYRIETGRFGDDRVIESVLHTFRNAGDGYVPYGPLSFDRRGLLFGATQFGGDSACSDGFGCGTVYALNP